MTKPILLLDFGNVLYHFLPKRRLDLLSELSGLSPGEVDSAIQASGIVLRLDQGIAGESDLIDFLQTLTGLSVSSELSLRIWGSAFSPNHHFVDILFELLSKFRVGVLSNNPDFFKEWIREETKIDNVFLSGEVGCLKPDPKIFRLVNAAMKTCGDDVLFIDDSETNLQAAAQFGWKTLLYRDDIFGPERLLNVIMSVSQC